MVTKNLSLSPENPTVQSVQKQPITRLLNHSVLEKSTVSAVRLALVWVIWFRFGRRVLWEYSFGAVVGIKFWSWARISVWLQTQIPDRNFALA
jgi:hypothetical protein